MLHPSQLQSMGFGTGTQHLTSTRLAQDALVYPVSRNMAESPRPQRPRTRSSELHGTGEVAKTLMPNRSDEQQLAGYPSYQYPAAQMPEAIPVSNEFSVQMETDRSVAEMVPAKRPAAPIENTTTKTPRGGRNRRVAVEDPSAPDVGDMDVVTEAYIRLEDEQEALFVNIPSQGVSDVADDLIKSNIINVSTVQSRLVQILNEQRMQCTGIDCLDLVVRGMEEQFESFLTKAVKRAIHKSETAHVEMETDQKAITSDIRSSFREIKRKQEQRKANKLREERERLERIAETASKKDLANNKELAAKVAKVRQEKQFNADAEAANRALSHALGGVGFEKFRKQKQDREAREAAKQANVSNAQPPASVPSQCPSVPISQPPSVQKVSSVREKPPIVMTARDVLSTMSQDNRYAFSPLLYRFHL